MRLQSKALLISSSLILVNLSGCSTISGLFGGGDENYRDTQGQIVENLEMPPNLFSPAKEQSKMSMALAKAERNAEIMQAQANKIPSYAAQGISIGSNLSERWLQIDSMEADKAWDALLHFFESQGFDIAEQRKDIGVIKTTYKKRAEIVPKSEFGPITRMLNAWRPEVADGALDKFIARMEAENGQVRIYINHHMMFTNAAKQVTGSEDEASTDTYRVLPYSPVMEAEELYQAMVFFGSSKEQAMSQIESTENMVEIEGGHEFDGLILLAGMEQSWNYLQSTVYRADWTIEKLDTNKKTLWVNVPETLRESEGLLSKLAFWKSSSKKALPKQLLLRLNDYKDDAQKTLLEVDVPEGVTPLTVEQRRYVFESLGLLGKR
ncbi:MULTISPECIES: outer membrane protein assembly factor BamC [Thiomicrorhabdus]|uniref:Outer membrane protein assembly factor BamC n=1 Tax=Thiomicrorhabdus heinhorstiae TaxID=2748010 RepID=A0ABS0BZ76_9GAMM|nr:MULTISPECIES: outer membrane protein assembly factor BamC [Thiomicrorhabdus]MBF6058289.1 outer membrane protein assembly factor BamC [Thiomicrorhabdus heinhorstiae]